MERAWVGSGNTAVERKVKELKAMMEQRKSNKYSIQVGVKDVKFAFDEASASALQPDSQMTPIEKAEYYLREGVLEPLEFVEYDGTVHQVLEWDPRPVGYSGFMDCVTHSVVVTDQGTFEIGRYAAVQLGGFSKAWQWFIHRKQE